MGHRDHRGPHPKRLEAYMSEPNIERVLQLLAQKLAQAELNAAYLQANLEAALERLRTLEESSKSEKTEG